MKRWFVAVVLVTMGFVGGALLTGRLQSRERDDPPPVEAGTSASQAQPQSGAVSTSLPDFTQVAARTSPAVVNISAVQVYRQRRFADPFFGNIFGDEDMYAARRGQSVFVAPAS